MKKIFFAFGASMAAIFAISSCNKEISNPDGIIKDGIPFEINASSVDTKTSIDGLSTNWIANDAINLFHAVAGSTDYVSDGSFSIAEEDLDDKKFKGTLASALEPENTYDWYAIYPYNGNISTPANTGTNGWVTVGGTTQAQKGNDSMAHLCETVCPLYGVASAVSSDVTPSIEMKHLTSIIEVNVTNNSGDNLTVENVSFTGSEDIVGTYFINFVGPSVGYNASGEKYVSNTASLSVSEGAVIANGSSAKFYIAVKPFTATPEHTLKVSVNGYEKEIKHSGDVTFTAGKIKKVNFNFDVIQTTYIWDLGINSTSVATEDQIGWTNSVADMLCVRAAGGTAANNYYPGTTDKSYTSTRFYLNSTLSITPKSGKSLTYYVFEATSANYANVLANSTWTNVEKYNVDGNTLTIIAKDPSVAVSAVIGGTCGFTKAECHTGAVPVFPPVISVTKSSFSVAATGDICTVNYSIENPVDGKVISATSNQSWVNNFDYDTNGEVSFTVDENISEARTATVTLYYEGAENVLITVLQYGDSSESGLGDAYLWTLASGDLGSSGSPLASISKGSPTLSWTASYDWPSGASKYLSSDSAKGVQIGSGSSTNKCNSLVLSSTSYSGSVSTIIVNGSIASSGNAKVEVKVNGNLFNYDTGTSASLATTAKEYKFTSDTPIAGTIEIVFTNSAAKAFYIKSIAINPAE